MLYITRKAAHRIRLSAQSSGCVDLPLRFSCHGPDQKHFQMGFDRFQEGDISWNCHDLHLICSPAHWPFLEHVVLDFLDDPENLPATGPQFVFLLMNPQESQDCQHADQSA